MSNIAVDRRKKLDLSQEEIAQRVNISRQYYNAIENNKKTPSVEVAKSLAKVLGVSWTIFFTDEVNK